MRVNFKDFSDFAGPSGFEGFQNHVYLVLFPPNDLGRINIDYQVETWAKGLLIFGSDGGGEAYGFDTRYDHWPVVKIPFIGGNWSIALPVGATFAAFLQNLRETPA